MPDNATRRKTGWRTSFTVKDLLSGSDDPANGREVAAAICARLTREIEYSRDDDFADIVDQFGDIESDNDEDVVANVNYCLERLYDWADDRRVWIA
jgi:hypothetical protein